MGENRESVVIVEMKIISYCCKYYVYLITYGADLFWRIMEGS